AMTDAIAPLPKNLELWQSTMGWQPDEAEQDLFQRLYAGVLDGNTRMNLTRIVAPDEFWEKHVWDSVRGIFSDKVPALAELRSHDPFAGLAPDATPEKIISLLDIGTGGGFPGLPIAIAQPNWSVTLLDSTRKKIAFAGELAETLELSNVSAIADRAEQIARKPDTRPQFDIVTLRAVGAADKCAGYALPLVANGGMAILYRGKWTAEEEESLAPILQDWGAEILAVDGFKTPLSEGDRHCVYLKREG
ncbi:MAG: 16S rRNA (guanine(527)-N(7))-methyltransferase RsmG, partial [Cyanobacteria bacterium P01_D01_bin.73]